MTHQEKFTDGAIVKEYEKYAFSKKKYLLPEIFKEDLVSGIAFYANTGKITVANIEEEYLAPAQKANATQCAAFLMNWQNQAIPQEMKEKQLKKCWQRIRST